MAAADSARDRERAPVLHEKRAGGNVAQRDALSRRGLFDDVDVAGGQRIAAGRNGGDRQRDVVAIGIDDDRSRRKRGKAHMDLR